MNREDVGALREAILKEAGRDRQRVINEAEAQARRITEQAESEAHAEAARVVHGAESKVAQIKREASGSARLEAQKLKVEKREVLLEAVFSRARERLADVAERDDYPEIVVALVEDAARHMPDTAGLLIAADERAREALDEATLQTLAERTGHEMRLGDVLDRDDEGGRRVGVVVRSGDGRLQYDNTLRARLERMHGALRAPVYRVLQGEGA